MDILPVRSSDIRWRTIPQEIPHSSFTKINLNITYLKCHLNPPGAYVSSTGLAHIRGSNMVITVPSDTLTPHIARASGKPQGPSLQHYDDVIMSEIASQITSLTIVYSTVHSGADQSKHQSSASLAFVWEIHRWPVNFPHKWPVTRKVFPFDDVIMNSIEVRTWISIYVYIKTWDVISHSCTNFYGDLVKSVLKLGHGWVITTQRILMILMI